ncbi:MAG TPA: hypothetical protein VIE89_07405 [Candidatus Binatia bacterium]
MSSRSRSSGTLRIVAHGFWVLVFLMTFTIAVDGPAANFASHRPPIVQSKATGFLGGEYGAAREPLAIWVLQNEPVAPPAFFLLFDCKQNLRLWPVLAGDISRSPPPLVAS